jgi:hypothetical protein
MAGPAIEIPAHDPLGVLTSTAAVMREARLVRLGQPAVAALAARWVDAPWPEQAGLDALHFADWTERTASWVLLLDALNFCFWGEPSGPRWQVEWRGDVLDGYYALAAALSRAVEEGRPLWDASYLAGLTDAELADILRPVPGGAGIPLFAERLANAREVGRVLVAHFGGQAVRAIDAAAGSAVALTQILAREFPSFHDVATWRGREVRFLKRAQICVADLHAAFGGEGWGAFADLDELTAFADYKLPQLLRGQGVLAYEPELADLIDHYMPLPPGSEAEVEIRAATIWAVELLRRALRERGVVRPATAIDYRLWAESQRPGPETRPYHRTRTIFY